MKREHVKSITAGGPKARWSAAAGAAGLCVGSSTGPAALGAVVVLALVVLVDLCYALQPVLLLLVSGWQRRKNQRLAHELNRNAGGRELRAQAGSTTTARTD